jgi:hypothetical protein
VVDGYEVEARGQRAAFERFAACAGWLTERLGVDPLRGRHHLIPVLDQIYASEIDAEVSNDGRAFGAKLGDPWNGYAYEISGLADFVDVVAWLDRTIRRRYPRSAYAVSRGGAGTS